MTYFVIPFVITILFVIIAMLCHKLTLKFVWITLGIILLNLVIAWITFMADAHIQTQAYEIRCYMITNIKHTERYSKRESRTRQVACGTDRKGNTRYRTETYYVTEYYGPYWDAVRNDGAELAISMEDYNRIKTMWKTECKTGYIAGSAAGWSTPLSANIYSAKWDNQFAHVESSTAIMSYINKVRKSQTIFNRKVNNPELLKKFPPPADNNDTAVLHLKNVTVSSDNDCLEKWNAVNGMSHQIHLLVYVLNVRDFPSLSITNDIVDVWKGVNKNELAIFVAIDPINRKVVWSKTVSWMDDTTMHRNIDSALIGSIFNAQDLQRVLDSNLKYWHRKQFKDFDYIKIDPDLGVAFWIGLVLQVVIAIVMLVVMNRQTYMRDEGDEMYCRFPIS